MTPSQIATMTSTITPAVVPSPSGAATSTNTATPQPAACVETQGRLSVAQLDSTVLSRRVSYSIYLPPCYGADPAHLYPALYLLHGASADHTQWPDLNVASDADLLIAQKVIAPFVVVMPGGVYQSGEDYAAFVLRDLIPHIEQTTHVATDRLRRAIGGVSLGGWWALSIASAHPELFSAVGGHSPVTDAALAQALALPGLQPALRIYLDVGSADSLAPGVKAFASSLEAHGLKPVLHVYPGAHDRPYWRAHTPEYLTFYAANW